MSFVSKRPRSLNWEQFVELYRAYRSKPVWGAWTIVPNKRLRINRSDVEQIRKRGDNAVKILEEAVEELCKEYKSPHKLGPIRFAALVRRGSLRPRHLAILHEAIVFDRDAYACRYCGRSVEGVWQAENKRRTIRLVVDHEHPMSRGGDAHHLRNCVTACWSCNTLKGPLSKEAFEQELHSLARAVTGSR